MSAPPAVSPLPVEDERVETRHFVAFFAMTFAMFMVLVDIQVVSASLPEMQAGLSASADEIPWVQTSYLIAKVIAVPLSGFLLRAFSTRITFTVAAAGFTLMSVMCATATTIDEMILWRSLQGFLGGPMIPAVFATGFTIFPRSKQYLVAPTIALVATLGPTIGPTIGGYLTEVFSWHWIFLINVVPGIFVTITAWTLIDFDKPNLKLLDDFDWSGLIGMALFMGALQYVLQEGPREDWLESRAIAAGTAVSAAGACLFFWRAFTAKHPIVDLTPFLDRNFWTGCVFGFVLGVGLHGLTYLYPIYLAGVRDYSPLMIGKTVFVTGLSQFIMAPIAGRLIRRFDLRLLIAIAFGVFAVSTWQLTFITGEWNFYELLLPQILRGSSLMLAISTINVMALGTLPLERLKSASAIYTLTRNFGGAVGLAVLTSILNKRMDLHLWRLRETVTWGRQAVEERLSALTETFRHLGPDAQTAALKKLAAIVRGEALVKAFADVFMVLTVTYAVVVVLLLLVRKTER